MKNNMFIVAHYYYKENDSRALQAIDWPKNVPIPSINESIGAFIKGVSYSHYRVFDIRYVFDQSHELVEIVIMAHKKSENQVE